MKIKRIGIFISVIGLLTLVTCQNKDNNEDPNFFSLQQDISLGKQLVDFIESDTSDVIVLEPSDYPVAYSHI